MFVVAIEACPSQAWTVTGSTPLVSQSQPETGGGVPQVVDPTTRRRL